MLGGYVSRQDREREQWKMERTLREECPGAVGPRDAWHRTIEVRNRSADLQHTGALAWMEPHRLSVLVVACASRRMVARWLLPTRRRRSGLPMTKKGDMQERLH